MLPTPQTQTGSDQSWSRFWNLEPGIAFLNHGSFGACLVSVLEAQSRYREQMEREPVRFFVRELPELLERARTALAEFLRADSDQLVFVPNATAGVNAVLRSLSFAPGDELLTTDHEYNACRNALEYVASRSRAKVIVAAVPFPLDSPERVSESLRARVTPRTRLLLIDHVTSQTGLVFPIEKIVAEMKALGVDCLVDGAHAPGMLPLDLPAIGAAYYTGNCHKWLCAPKGAAFLWVRRDRQTDLHPTSISHGFNAPGQERSRFRVEFDWTGTDDPTAFLCVPEAILALGGLLPGGWPELMQRNRALALSAREIVGTALGIAAPCPEAMVGSLATLPLPDGASDPPTSALYRDPLQDALLDRFGIEVPVVPWPAPPKRLIRLSAQLYNNLDQYRWLGDALRELLKLGGGRTDPRP